MSVRRSVGPSVRLAEIDKSDKSDKSKPENLTNLTKSDKSLCNSILVPSFGRIFVQTNLFCNALKSVKKRLKKTPLDRFELTTGQPLIIRQVSYHIAIQLLQSIGLNGNEYLT